MKYDAVIFDLDGTLLDTLADIGNAMNRVLEKCGFAVHPLDAYRHFIGDGVAQLVERSLAPAHVAEEDMSECLQAFREEYARSWHVDTRPYAGIPELLDRLVERRVKLAVLSNKPHAFTIQCVERFLGAGIFEIVQGQHDGLPRKPDPAGAYAIAGLLQVNPPAILSVGDSAVDIRTAVAAGMFPAGALWGFRSREELHQAGARALLRHPLDVLGLFV